MAQLQHLISGWLLRAFSRGGSTLAAFDKLDGSYLDVGVNDFLAELDAHGSEIEQAINELETPAAAAALRLRKRVSRLPAGLYAMALTDELSEPELTDHGVMAGMRLLVGTRTLAQPPDADREALSRYAALMYQRAPRTEAAMRSYDEAFDRGARQALDELLPEAKSPGAAVAVSLRERMVERAYRLGATLTQAPWWVVRAPDREAFVLSDSMVVATLSFGHDDDWRAILSPEAYAVVMALGPRVALIMAPRGIFPFSGGLELGGLPRAINRLMWRAADRYILATRRSELETAMSGVDELTRRFSVAVPQDDAAIEAAGRNAASKAVAQAYVQRIVVRPLTTHWVRWEGCRLRIGWLDFDAADRPLFGLPACKARS